MQPLLLLAVLCLSVLMSCQSKDSRLESLSTWLAGAAKIPSPAKVVSTGDWYLLNHVTGKLIEFDHVNNRFIPLLAESWTISGSTYQFKIREDAKYSDGSPVTADDVAASLKFLILQRTSTHFPAWEYFAGCEDLKSITSPCEHIKVIDRKTVSMTLKQRMQSFFLLLSSPEGGIWKAEDLERLQKGEAPKACSGPYYLTSNSADQLWLESNKYFAPADWFPNRPTKIRSFSGVSAVVKPEIAAGNVDIYFDASRPFADYSHEPEGFEIKYSAPTTILYFFRVGKKTDLIERSLVESYWKDLAAAPDLVPASSFLPFTSRRGINQDQFLKALPEGKPGRKEIRVAALTPYFSDGLLDFLAKRAEAVGVTIKYVRMDAKEWFEAFNHLDTDKFDFILSAYVATERFPSVQVRYLLEGHKIPFDISPLDSPDWGHDQAELLLKVERFILDNQLVIPLYFLKNQIRHSSKVDIGEQPILDAEIQLWRVTKAR